MSLASLPFAALVAIRLAAGPSPGAPVPEALRNPVDVLRSPVADVLRSAATLERPFAVRPFRNDATAVFWLSDAQGYIWQLDRKATIVGVLTDCEEPAGIKVDRNGNLWAACTDGSTIQEYTPGASTASLVLDDTPGFYPNDVAVDEHGDVYAVNIEGIVCRASSCTSYPGNVVYWKAAQRSNGALPTGVIADPNMYEGSFIDTDDAGNLYVDMLNQAAFAGETDRIGSPREPHPSITNLGIDPDVPGGVYVSNGGTVLNVLDQQARTIGRYRLPGITSLGVLGSLPQNYEKSAQPIGFGFSKGDRSVAVADAGCRALDLGAVQANTFVQLLNASFVDPVGAAFVTSDK